MFLQLFAFSQVTLVLQPGASDGKDADIRTDYPSTPNGGSQDFIANAWTAGMVFVQRSLIEFDLSSIPQNALIISANLSLYANPTTGHSQHHSSLSGSNTAFLKRIVNHWNENAVCWNNQPGTTDMHRIILPQSTSSLQDYLNIDVTQMMQDMVTFPGTSFGMMFMLATEEHYRSLIFASSDHPNASLHPKLVITYDATATWVDTCIVIKVMEDRGYDADIRDDFPTSPNPASQDFIANAWSAGSQYFIQRSLIDFGVTTLPPNTFLNCAMLSLYGNPTTGHYQNHSSLSGPNESYLQRITSSWDQNTVCWNNQPSYSTQNQVTLSKSYDTLQNYLDIDVTDLMVDMLTYPSSSFGFLLKLVTESQYRSMVFASSDHVNPDLHPKLTLCYSTITSMSEVNKSSESMQVFPNPANGIITVQLAGKERVNLILDVIDVNGRKVISRKDLNKSPAIQLDVSRLNKGLYIIRILDGNESSSRRIIID